MCAQDMFCYRADYNVVIGVAKSIYDSDMMKYRLSGKYLERSAIILRNMIGDTLRKDKGCELRRVAKLVLNAELIGKDFIYSRVLLR